MFRSNWRNVIKINSLWLLRVSSFTDDFNTKGRYTGPLNYG
ncbi:hypothetical protein SAMN04488109_6682 [Chryseolinea serpens]|uniref:Uncharacterized protein n=1 Tax=Chryseolinea serpens TaxID=947013 RepID=A0A1M5XKM7_9BACT|nr:hypothetical protein SAMN04488109_6682 [Chryseolinea serpens]